MYVLIDMRPFLETEGKKKGFFCENFLHGIFRNHPEDVFYLWTTGKDELTESLRFDGFKNVRRVHTHISSDRLHALSRMLKYPFLDDLVETVAMKQGYLPWVAKFDAFFFCRPFPFLLEDNCFPVFFSEGFHPLYFPEQYPKHLLSYQNKKWYTKVFDSAELICSPSEFHTQEIVKGFGENQSEKILTLNTGFTTEEEEYTEGEAERFQEHITSEATLESFEEEFEGQELYDALPMQYFLAQGDTEESLETVIKGFELFCTRFPEKDIPLILLEHFPEQAIEYRRGEKIVSFYTEKERDFSVLFSKASVFIDMNTYDPFARNVLFSLRCKTPVVVREESASEEFVGDEVFRCEGRGAVSVFKALKEYETLAQTQSQLFPQALHSRFSWDDIGLKIMHELKKKEEKRDQEEG